MTFLNKVISVLRPTSINGPTFIKEESNSEKQLQQLKALFENASGEMRIQIETDMKLLSQGIYGENNIAFELRNSHLPMLIIHDLNLEFQGLTAQIDYVIITKCAVVIVECKNLFGNLEINSNGDFIRTLEFNGKFRKEGIYSPITQNQRHFELIRQARLAYSNNLFDRMMKTAGLNSLYRTIVVLANPKTVINMKYAKKEIKEKIIRADQLITYLRKVNQENNEVIQSDESMYSLADFFLKLHRDEYTDYTSKYRIDIKPDSEIELPETQQENIPIEDTPIYVALKEYRLHKSREKEIKAYYIYNNTQMEEIIKAMPSNLEELIKINGFGQQKITDYGIDIINICGKYR